MSTHTKPVFVYDNPYFDGQSALIDNKPGSSAQKRLWSQPPENRPSASRCMNFAHDRYSHSYKGDVYKIRPDQDFVQCIVPRPQSCGANTNSPQRNINCKREDYLDWTEYFMATAFLAAKRSKDPCSQVGACIVNKENKIVGIGYNGMPTGCDDNVFPWAKNTTSRLDSKFLYVCHAEMNAILNKNTFDVKNCTIYVGLFPCNECAKIIIQSGITEVVYLSDKHAHKDGTVASKRMFDAVGVKYWQYKPKTDQIVIDFTEIDWNNVDNSTNISGFQETSTPTR